jgi:CheY-like chemotaxis protein
MSKVLLVEADTPIISLLETLLEIDGYEVAAFRGREDILDMVRRERPDLVLLDVNLKNFGIQDRDGFDVLRAIRADDGLKSIGVVMSSGMNYQRECDEAGADGFVMKPYMPDDLLDLIRETIANKNK